MPIATDTGLRYCNECGRTEDETHFYPSDRAKCAEHRNVQRQAWRAENRERTNEVARNWRAANPDRQREIMAKSRYGITISYAALFEAQDGRCAACGHPGDERGLAIDHDHETGRVRGLLCHPCNLALGFAREDPDRLRGLIAYIEGGQ